MPRAQIDRRPVCEGREEILTEARGMMHRGFRPPNCVETRFDTASLGKFFTAVTVFRMIDRGLIGLGEKVRDIVDLEGTRIPRDLAGAHCLTHSSGIADDADEEAGEDYGEIFKTKPCYTLREASDFLPQFAHKEPIFPAGTKSRYNNCAHVLVGLAIEAKTGLPFRKLVERGVLAPAGLPSSGYFAKDGIEPNVAEGYASIEGKDGCNPGVAAIAMRYPKSEGFVAVLANQDASSPRPRASLDDGSASKIVGRPLGAHKLRDTLYLMNWRPFVL